MSKVFNNSYIRPVYFNMGQVNGQKVFKRAPFDVLVINGVLSIQHVSIGCADSAFAQLSSGDAEAQNNWRVHDFGYEVLNPIILDENQMGDGSDNWMGVNSISDI